MPIKKLQALKDKYSRAQDASPSVECGLVYLPHPSIAPWVKDLRDEVKSFPVGKHDDQVDCLVYAVIALCINQLFQAPSIPLEVETVTQLENQGWTLGGDSLTIPDKDNPWMEHL